METRVKWQLSGDCVEGCTSPPVCPAYWNSPLPAQLHEGESRCEGVWTFLVEEGHYQGTDLAGLMAAYAFNSPAPFPERREDPWKCLLYIDGRADARQAEALESIFRTCWGVMGEVLAVKRASISFEKEIIGGGGLARHRVTIGGIYELVARPFRTSQNGPRYVNSRWGGHINVGISEVNRFHDPALPRGQWDAPGMSVTYYRFHLDPQKLHWLP